MFSDFHPRADIAICVGVWVGVFLPKNFFAAMIRRRAPLMHYLKPAKSIHKTIKPLIMPIVSQTLPIRWTVGFARDLDPPPQRSVSHRSDQRVSPVLPLRQPFRPGPTFGAPRDPHNPESSYTAIT